jgi:hypothetical protein
MAQALADSGRDEPIPAAFVGLAWVAAVLGLLGALATRALAPALAGVWVGTDELVAWVELVAAVLAQSFALVGLSSALGQTVLLARGSRPVVLRALGVGVAGLVAMAMASSMFVVLPEMSGLVAGIGAASFALMAALRAGRDRAARWLALVLGACATAGLLRMASWALLDWLRTEAAPPWFSTLAGAGAAGALGLDLVALAAGFGWLLGPRIRAGRVAVVVLALGLAAGWTWLSVREPSPDSAGAVVWLGRALDRLVVGPIPWLPPAGRAMVEASAVALAAASLARPAPTRIGAAVVALAVVGRAALEAPACALSLLLGAMLLTLGSGATAGRRD